MNPIQSEERRREILDKLSAFACEHEAIGGHMPVWVIDYIAIQDDERDRLAAECAAKDARIAELLEEAKKDTAAMLSAAQTCQDGKQAVESLRSQLAASQAREAMLKAEVEAFLGEGSGWECPHGVPWDQKCPGMGCGLDPIRALLSESSSATSALDAAIAKAREEAVLEAVQNIVHNARPLRADNAFMPCCVEELLRAAGLREGEKP